MTETAEVPPEQGRERIKYRVKKRRVAMFGQNFLDTRRGRRIVAIALLLSVIFGLAAIWYLTPRLLGPLGDSGGGSNGSESPQN